MATRTNVLSIASGGGGLDLGVRLAVPDARTVCYVENEITACAVLAARIQDVGLDDAPIWTDAKTFDGEPWRGVVDLIIGGYPCQPFSLAGKGAGHDDPRNLWPAIRGTIDLIRPRRVFFENVGAHLRRGFYEVAGDLRDLGCRVAATLVTAAEVGAPHKRERLFIMADLDVGGLEGGARIGASAHKSQAWDDTDGRGGTVPDASSEPQRVESGRGRGARGQCAPESRHDSEAVADATHDHGWGGVGSAEAGARPDEVRRRGSPVGGGELGDAHVERPQGRRGPVTERGDELPAWPPSPEDDWGSIPREYWPATQPEVRGVADGVAEKLDLARSDRLRILGNGVVPAQAAAAYAQLDAALRGTQ